MPTPPTTILRKWSTGHYRTVDQRWLVDKCRDGGWTITDTVGARSFHAATLLDARHGIADRYLHPDQGAA